MTEISAAVTHGDTAFVLLPTPSRPDGSFDSSTLAQAVTDLCSSIRAQNKQRFLIVIGSTVSPGTIAGTVVPIVERILEQPIGETVSVCYNPEFVALGSVVTDFERPDLILIGESHDCRRSGGGENSSTRRCAIIRRSIVCRS